MTTTTCSQAMCPRCKSTAPHLHPAVQHGGEVGICNDGFHRTVTPQNTPEKIARTYALARLEVQP